MPHRTPSPEDAREAFVPQLDERAISHGLLLSVTDLVPGDTVRILTSHRGEPVHVAATWPHALVTPLSILEHIAVVAAYHHDNPDSGVRVADTPSGMVVGGAPNDISPPVLIHLPDRDVGTFPPDLAAAIARLCLDASIAFGLSHAIRSNEALRTLLVPFIQHSVLSRLPGDRLAISNLTAILNIARAIASENSFDAMMRVLSSEMKRLLPLSAIMLFQPDQAGTSLRSTFVDAPGVPIPPEGWVIPHGEGYAWQVFHSGQPFRVTNDPDDPRGYFTSEELRQSLRGSQAIQIPLVANNETIGVLSVSRNAPPFSDLEYDLVTAVAGQGGFAIRQAALINEARSAAADATARAARLDAVLASSSAIAAELGIEATLNRLSEQLAALVQQDVVAILEPSPDGTHFHSIATRIHGENFLQPWSFSANDPEIAEPHGDPEPYTTPITRQTVIPGLDADTSNLLLIPVRIAERVTALILIGRSGELSFNDDDITTAALLADQVAIGIRTTRLVTIERRRRQTSTAIQRCATALNRAATIQEICEGLAEVAATSIGVPLCSLFVYNVEGDQTEAFATFGFDSNEELFGPLSKLAPQDVPVERRLIETRQPVTGDEFITLFAQLGASEVDSIDVGAAIPVIIRGTVQGAMYVGDHRDPLVSSRISDHHLSMLEAICEQAAIAIERARLVTSTNRKVAELAVVSGVNEAMLASTDLAGLVRTALERAREVTPFATGVVLLTNPDGETLTAVEAIGSHRELLRNMSPPMDRSIAGRVFKSGLPFIGEVSAVQAYYPNGAHIFGKYAVSVPLQSDNGILGVMSLTRDEPGEFSGEDLNLVRLLAGQLMLGIERSRSYDRALVERAIANRRAQQLGSVLRQSSLLAQQTSLAAVLDAFSRGIDVLVHQNLHIIFIVDAERTALRAAKASHSDDFDVAIVDVPLGRGLASEVYYSGEPQLFSSVQDDPRVYWPAFRPEQVAAIKAAGLHIMVIPLMVEGERIGVLLLDRIGGEPFSEEEFAIVRLYASQGATSIRNAELLERNRELYLGGIRALVETIDAKDSYTRGHSERVSRYARAIAEDIGLEPQVVEQVELAGMLHDIGKIGVPDSILQKPGKLDEAERIVMMRHASMGADILESSRIDSLRPLVPFVRHHHEWLNGRGYPDGLVNDQIPLGAAILAVVDAFDTITTDRPYRARRSVATALDDLRAVSGERYRADVITSLERLVESGAILPPDGPTPGVTGIQGAFSVDGAGQLGDARAVALLIELPALTRHIIDMGSFLAQVCALVRRRLEFEDVSLYLLDADHRELILAAHDGLNPHHVVGSVTPVDSSLVGKAAATGTVGFDYADLGEPHLAMPRQRMPLCRVAVPLMIDDRVLGVLYGASQRLLPLNPVDITIVEAAASHVAAAIQVAQLHDTLKRTAGTDGLTGLANHRAFHESLALTREREDLFSVILFDVEGLKEVNDTAGHFAGDALLRAVATAINASVRERDLAARYGGDEFAVILDGATREQAVTVAQRVRERLLADSLVITGLLATVRYGVASAPGDGIVPAQLVNIAEKRMLERRSREYHPIRR